jgi:TolB-like protein/DNA-binding winged helix-turn-helix (wHTH) protein/tetratricopeptide (TPR) repeat protein
MDSSVYRFGDFVLDPRQYELWRGDARIYLQPKTFDVLHYLVRHAGRVVTKDELIAAVWPGVVVTEHSLTRCIKDIRRALDDDAGEPRYIETLVRRGYRLKAETSTAVMGAAGVATVEAAAPVEIPAPASPTPTPPSAGVPWFRRPLALAAAAAVLLIGALLWFQREPAAPTAEPVIAVLPFANLSPDPALQLFADGVAEDLLDLLAQTPQLRVVARTSSFALRGADRDVRDVGRRLGADWVLEGSVRLDGNRIRVTAQLIDAATGHHAWSSRYERAADDLFAVQDDIARAVVAQVGRRLSLGDATVPAPPTRNFQAHMEYMTGRDLLHRRPADWHAPARAALERAIALDPQFARAHATLGIVDLLAAQWQVGPDAGGQRAQAAIARALALEPNEPVAHAARGLSLLLAGDPVEAEAALKRALQADPVLTPARIWLASSLAEQGRAGEQRQQLEAGLAIDPLNPTLHENLGALLQSQGRYEEAVRAYERLLVLPERPATLWVMRGVHLGFGNLTEALRWSLRMQRAAPAGSARSTVPALAVLAQLGQLAPDDPKLAAVAGIELNSAWLLEVEAALRRIGRVESIAPLAAAHAPAAGMPPSLWYGQLMGRVAAFSGDPASAVTRLAPYFPPRVLRQGPGAGGLQWDTWLTYVWALQQRGETTRARNELEAFQRTVFPSGVPAEAPPDIYYLAALAAALGGDADGALAQLDAALARGWNDAALMRHDPRWGALADNPRVMARRQAAAAAAARHRDAVAAMVAASEPDFVALRR